MTGQTVVGSVVVDAWGEEDESETGLAPTCSSLIQLQSNTGQEARRKWKSKTISIVNTLKQSLQASWPGNMSRSIWKGNWDGLSAWCAVRRCAVRALRSNYIWQIGQIYILAGGDYQWQEESTFIWWSMIFSCNYRLGWDCRDGHCSLWTARPREVKKRTLAIRSGFNRIGTLTMALASMTWDADDVFGAWGIGSSEIVSGIPGVDVVIGVLLFFMIDIDGNEQDHTFDQNISFSWKRILYAWIWTFLQDSWQMTQIPLQGHIFVPGHG